MVGGQRSFAAPGMKWHSADEVIFRCSRASVRLRESDVSMHPANPELLKVTGFYPLDDGT